MNKPLFGRFPIQILEPNDFPDLWQVQEPPQALYVQGSPEAIERLKELPERGLAIVGTRRAQPRTLSHVRRVVRDLQEKNLIIVSGLALGVDATAHEAALEAELMTVAVLGGGLENLYPKENIRLAERILEKGGVLISEFPPLSVARAHRFLMRNRLIAGWSKGVWVAEASHRSGALNTAKWARDHHSICFATPCFPGDPAFAGNENLMHSHATLPLWNAQSLGAAWLEMATVRLGSRAKNPARWKNLGTDTDLEQLASRVHALTAQQGGVHVQELLEWATGDLNWRPGKFFISLKNGLELGKFEDRNGHLSSPL